MFLHLDQITLTIQVTGKNMDSKSVYDYEENAETEETSNYAGAVAAPKKRHRRTKEELLKDPVYREKHGLPPLDAEEYDQAEEAKEETLKAETAPSVRRRRRRIEEEEVEVDDSEAKEEAPGGEEDTPEDPLAEDETAKYEEDAFKDSEVISIKPPPAPSFKHMYESQWCFEIWDTKTDHETCIHTQQLPNWVDTYESAFEETKKYCNRHLREISGCNVVIFQVHSEFRLSITQVTLQQ